MSGLAVCLYFQMFILLFFSSPGIFIHSGFFDWFQSLWDLLRRTTAWEPGWGWASGMRMEGMTKYTQLIPEALLYLQGKKSEFTSCFESPTNPWAQKSTNPWARSKLGICNPINSHPGNPYPESSTPTKTLYKACLLSFLLLLFWAEAATPLCLSH